MYICISNNTNNIKPNIMTTYNILNHTNNIIKTVTVKNIEEANDIIYDLKDYHGHYSVYTLEEVKLQDLKCNKVKVYEARSFILNELGIGCDVIVVDDKNCIKVNNHFALFTLIGEIRRKFNFTVHHKKDKNEFLITIYNE